MEQEYNAPHKPESARDVDRKMISKKLKILIDNYCKQNKVSFEEIIKHLLKENNEDRGINPNAKDEHDLIEDILYDMLGQEEEK